jgi:hypothetical protein
VEVRSALVLFVCALVLSIVGLASPDRRRRQRRHVSLCPLLFLFLSIMSMAEASQQAAARREQPTRQEEGMPAVEPHAPVLMAGKRGSSPRGLAHRLSRRAFSRHRS